jgi:hypothetical protein
VDVARGDLGREIRSTVEARVGLREASDTGDAASGGVGRTAAERTREAVGMRREAAGESREPRWRVPLSIGIGNGSGKATLATEKETRIGFFY